MGELKDNKIAAAILIILLTTLLAAIPAAAIFDNRVEAVEATVFDHEVRIKGTEAHVARDEQSQTDVNNRLERIERKLDRLIERDGTQ